MLRRFLADGEETALALNGLVHAAEDSGGPGPEDGGKPTPEEIIERYQVAEDPGGMVDYPDGVAGWLAGKLGVGPIEMTAVEAEHMDDIGQVGAKDAYDIYKTALNRAENVFEGQGETHGHSDAFRHAYWNAMLTQRFGEEWTASYTTAHERVPDQPRAEEAMDLHNNEVGRRIAMENPDSSPEELEQLVADAVRGGEMVVITPEQDLSYSDDIEMGRTFDPEDDPTGSGIDHDAPAPEHTTEGNWSGGYNPGSDGDSYGTAQND